MKTKTRLVALAASLFCGGLAALPAAAQWSNSSINPFIVADLPGDNGLPAMVPLSDGGCYLAWRTWESGHSGYDTRVQRLNAAGVEQWGHNGVLAAVGTSTSTIVGGMDIALASDGGLFVTHDARSDAAFPAVRQANVQKLSAAGVKLWGTSDNGIAVSTGEYGGAPAQVCAMPDGGCLVAYTVSPPSNVAAKYINMMRYTSAGVPAWASAKFIFQSGVNLIVTDVQPGESDTYIVSWVRNKTETEFVTQKFTGTGVAAAGWPSPITLDSHGLTNHDFPGFISDGAGGGIYAWRSYNNSGFGSGSDALLQHVLANGTLKFASPVLTVDPVLEPTRGRQTASVAYNATEGSYFVGFEQGPVSNGIHRSTHVQKISSAGARLWTGTGFVVVPEPANQQVTTGNVKVHATSDGGCIVLGTVTRGPTGTASVVFATKVNTVGGFPSATWEVYVDSNVNTSKGRMAVVPSTGSDDAILAYSIGGGLDDSIAVTRVASSDGAPGVEPEEPYFLSDPPVSVTVCDNGDVTLSVEVEGTPNIGYRWQRHYAAVADAWWYLGEGDNAFGCIIPDDGTTYSGTSTASLTIHNAHALPPMITCTAGTMATSPDYNAYRCIVFNAASDQPAVSLPTTLNVESCGNPCPADFNNVNGVTVQDIFDFLTAWLAGNASADFNHVNGVTVQDIFDFLTAWLAGC